MQAVAQSSTMNFNNLLYVNKHISKHWMAFCWTHTFQRGVGEEAAEPRIYKHIFRRT